MEGEKEEEDCEKVGRRGGRKEIREGEKIFLGCHCPPAKEKEGGKENYAFALRTREDCSTIAGLLHFFPLFTLLAFIVLFYFFQEKDGGNDIVQEGNSMPRGVALCGASDYDPYAPTKQNLLCGGRPALEVVMASGDFHVEEVEQGLHEQHQGNDIYDPRYGIHQYSKNKLVCSRYSIF